MHKEAFSGHWVRLEGFDTHFVQSSAPSRMSPPDHETQILHDFNQSGDTRRAILIFG